MAGISGMNSWDSIALIAGLWLLAAAIVGLFVGVRLRGLTSSAAAVERHRPGGRR
jgi:hypothetical protein